MISRGMHVTHRDRPGWRGKVNHVYFDHIDEHVFRASVTWYCYDDHGQLYGFRGGNESPDDLIKINDEY